MVPGQPIPEPIGQREHPLAHGNSRRTSSTRCAVRSVIRRPLQPGAQEAERLIIVGEPPLDAEASVFLSRMRERFSLPVYYQQFDLNKGVLIE